MSNDSIRINDFSESDGKFKSQANALIEKICQAIQLNSRIQRLTLKKIQLHESEQLKVWQLLISRQIEVLREFKIKSDNIRDTTLDQQVALVDALA